MSKQDSKYQGSIFSAEEMTRTMKSSLDFSEDKPVTVLGKTFDNEKKRREYYREELRKKFPELRKIEGFPIGSDDDIINLSDPPYYTACPNPWLNDFIEEWEKEKVELEKKGKRKSNFNIDEPFAGDVSVGKNNPVYSAHPYHTKVPHPAIMRYILHYTQPGDIIFDGFAGTGMTGVASASCLNSSDEIAEQIKDEWKENFGYLPKWGFRHSICGDLSPYASNISNFFSMPLNADALKIEVARIKKKLEKECGWMYTTTNSKGKATGRINFVLWSDVMVCPNCGHEYVYWDNGVSMDNMRVTSLESYPCPSCGCYQSRKTAKFATETYFDDGLNKIQKRVKQVPVIVVGKDGKEKIQRSPNEYDFELLKRIEETKIDSWYPIETLPDGYEPRRIKAREVYCAHQFYTKRTLIALSKLYSEIESSEYSFALRFMFTSLLNLISKRNRVQAKNPYSRGQGVLNLTLVFPPFPTEASLLEMLDMRLLSIIKAKEFIPNYRLNAQYTASADNLNIADNSVDYIFVDPPFGANINYSELNSMPEPWLRVLTNNSHEAIINETQGKNELTYRETMTKSFSEFFRILKPGKWMTVEFSNTSASVWNSIQNSLQQAGFIIANVAALDKKQGGMNANMNNKSVKQDLAISCYKPSTAFLSIDNKTHNIDPWLFIDEHLQHLAPHLIKEGKMISLPERDQRILYDRLISFYVQRGYPVPLDAHEFQQGLKDRYIERDGMFFTAVQAAEYEEKKKMAPEFVSLGIIVKDEASGIQWIKNQLSNQPKAYNEISNDWMQAIKGGLRKNDILPELIDILKENFIETEDNKWRLPNIHDDVDKDALRTKSLLREFKKYVEAASKPKGKIQQARLEALRAGFKQCYIEKDFKTIMLVGDKIPQNLRDEDEVLLQFYDIALNKI